MSLILVFILGTIIGSFLNVVVCRLPEKRSIVSQRSCCPHCQKSIRWYDLIPIASFFILGGKCRECHKKISWQYPLVEFVTGGLFVFWAWHYGLSDFFSNPFFYRDLVFTGALIIIFLTDLKHYLIFDAVTLPVTFFAIIFNVYFLSSSLTLGRLSANYLLAMIIGVLFFGSQYWLSKGKWLGAGDIRMGLMMGAMLGLMGLFYGLVIGYCLGALVAIILLILRKKGRKDELPLGVFLSLSAFVVLALSLAPNA